MLPLLPALLLLLLQGPSNFERSVADGRLPAALEVIHRELVRPIGAQLTEGDEQTLASLLAAGIDTDFSHAFLAYLRKAAPKPTPTPRLSEEIEKPVLPETRFERLQDGFTQCRRSRDGPATLAS